MSQKESLLDQAKDGNAKAREQLIENSRDFILQEAQRTCSRNLVWGTDEELSVALMAFNDAINTFQRDKGKHLETLARIMIRRRLIDFFRKNRNTSHPAALKVEDLAIEEDWEQKERQKELLHYNELLQSFGLSFSLLVKKSPKHKGTRRTLQKAAGVLSSKNELMAYLHKHHKLPQKDLCRLAGITPRVLERGRAYVIALALLLSGDEFPHLKGYVKVLTEERGESS